MIVLLFFQVVFNLSTWLGGSHNPMSSPLCFLCFPSPSSRSFRFSRRLLFHKLQARLKSVPSDFFPLIRVLADSRQPQSSILGAVSRIPQRGWVKVNTLYPLFFVFYSFTSFLFSSHENIVEMPRNVNSRSRSKQSPSASSSGKSEASSQPNRRSRRPRRSNGKTQGRNPVSTVVPDFPSSRPGRNYSANQSIAKIFQGPYKSWARQIMYPGESSNPSVLPAETAGAFCARRIQKSFVIDGNSIAADGTCALMMSPNLLSPVEILQSGVSYIPVAPGQVNIQAELKAGANTTQMFHISDITGAHADEPSSAIVDAAAVVKQGIYLATNNPCHISWSIAQVGQYDGPWTVKLWVRVPGGNWSAATSTPVVSGANHALTQGTATIGTGDAICLSLCDSQGVVLPANQTLHVKASLAFSTTAGDGPSQFSGVAAKHLYRKIGEYIMESNIEDCRLTGMSMLVINTSAALEKQGDIYIGRIPRAGATSFTSDMPSYMAALPQNRVHIGAAEFGGYAWWYPDVIETQNPAPIEAMSAALSRQDILFCYMKGLDARSSFQVVFNWNVEFYTPNQLFEKIPTPIMTQDWRTLMCVLSSVPAASCNPDHFELFKQLIQRAYSGAQSVASHYKEHKALYDGLFGLLAKAL